MNRKIPIQPWLFLTAAAIFDEWLLLRWTVHEVQRPELLLIFSGAFGLLLGIAVSLIPNPRRAKQAAVAAASAIGIIRFGMYVVFDTYQEFLTPATITGGAAGVASEFLSIAIKAVLGNLWHLPALLIPVIGYGLFGYGVPVSRRTRSVLVIACAVLYLWGFGQTDASSWRFDSAVRKAGLHGGFLLELRRSGAAEPEFLPAEEALPAGTEEQPETTAPAAYQPQVLSLDFEALAEAENRKGIRALHTYVAAQEPSSKNEFTGLFAGKNLIFITAEAFSAPVIDKDLTPTLYRLATEGIFFGEYYQPAWGGSTTSGEFSNLVGLVPVGGGKCMEEACQQELFFTIGAQLQKQGYYSAAFHNHSHTYYNRDETHERLGYDTFLAMGSGMEAGVSRRTPESDLEMMEFTVPLYLDRQPFSVYYMTMSGHALYSREGNAMSRRNYHRVEALSYPETVKCYLAANLELEDALSCLLKQLEEAGIGDETVIVLASDHYPYGLEKGSAWGNEENYLKALFGKEKIDCFTRDRSALIIWSGSIEGKGIRVDTPVYSLDILPTLSNLFDVPFDSRLLAGRDVFSDAQPLVLWPDHSWRTELGFYNASSGQFTPEAGVIVEDGYRKRIDTFVSNRITYSEGVCRYDYFNVLAPLVE